MFLRYAKKTILTLIVIFVIASGLFLTNKSYRTIGFFGDISMANKEVAYPKVNLSTPFNDSLEISETFFPDRTCNIIDYGAVSDGQTKNTQAFAKAIYACAELGGGKVIVPPGTWLTGPIKLESNIDLEVQKDATILFSTDFNDYLPPVFSRFEGIEYYNYSPPIHANNAENIALTGEGTLNGQGQPWWKFSGTSISQLYSMGEKNEPVDQRVFATTKNGLRPSFIDFVNCNRIYLSGLSILNGPMWTIHPTYSQNIIIKNINVETSKGASTDGIVIDSSKNVLVDTATLSTGDDAITIKSGRDNDGRRINLPSENIVLQNITVNEAHGAVALGSEMSGNIRNVLAKNFTVKNAQYGFRVKSNQQRGGTAENIWIDGMQINSLSQAAIQLNTYYERGNTNYTDYPPTFQNIHLSNINCHSTTDSINIFGLKGEKFAVNNLSLKNISILKSRNGLEMNNAKNVSLENLSIFPKYGPIFDFENSQNVTMSGSSCTNPSLKCLLLEGNDTQAIQLDKNNFVQKKHIIFGPEVDKNQVSIQ